MPEPITRHLMVLANTLYEAIYSFQGRVLPDYLPDLIKQSADLAGCAGSPWPKAFKSHAASLQATLEEFDVDAYRKMPEAATRAARAELATKGIQALKGMLELAERFPLDSEATRFLEGTRQCVSIIAYRRDNEGLPVRFSDPTE